MQTTDTEETEPKSDLAAPVTRERCRERAREIALLDGRSASEVRWEDYFRAKREVTGENDPDRQDAILDNAVSPITRTAMFAMSVLQLV